MSRPRLVLALASTLVAGVALRPVDAPARRPGHTAPVAPMAATGAMPTFGRPTISSIQGWGFEPAIRQSPDGLIYTTSPNTLSSTTSWIWRSLDGGKTFKWIPASAPLQGKLPTCVGGGDSEIALDSEGNLYHNDLTLVNFSTARSDDQGQTFTPPNCTAVETTPNDRQWYTTDGDPTNGGNLYLTYNIVAGGNPVCENGLTANNQLVLARSPLPGTPETAGVQFAPAELIGGPCDEAIMGPVEVSPVSHRIFVIHDNDALNAIRIARCEAVPFTTRPSGLECVDLPVASFPGFKTGANFPTMGIDTAGNLFAVWEQAPLDGNGEVVGDTLLYWSSSTDEGDTWTAPVQIPTPGLHNNIFAWTAAGDAGRVNIAWYGTEAVDPTPGSEDDCNGPDGAVGYWTLYLTQTLNGTAAVPTFTPPIVASEKFVSHSGAFTLIGGQCGERLQLGDFFQLRTGLNGEAIIAFSDSLNRVSELMPKNMFVRQVGGTGLIASNPVINGAIPPTNRTLDVADDATYEASGMVSETQPNLDLLSSSFSRPDPDHYRVTMTVADLTSLAPDPTTGNSDTTLVWQTQWIVPSTNPEAVPGGGENFFAYMQSVDGGPPTFWIGRGAVTLNGGGVYQTYPGETQVQGSYTATAPGTITIDVPIGSVSVPDPLNSTLYSVTSTAMTYPAPSECSDANPCFNGIGGLYFNLIDVAPAYDFIPPMAQVGGHAHTDVSGTFADTGDDIHIHFAGVFDDTSDAEPPAGLVRFRDLRPNRLGAGTPKFSCFDGVPTFVAQVGKGAARVDGTISCSSLPTVASFSADVTNLGTNPPKRDRYRMRLFDAEGELVYDSGGRRTTVGLGDLRVQFRV